MRNRKIIISILVFSLLLAGLTGCKSLVPEEKKEVAETTNKEEEKVLPKGEVNPSKWIEAEELEMQKAKPLSDELMKNTLRMDVVDFFTIGKDNIDLPKYNTLFSVRPHNTVVVVNITGNNYVKGRVYEIQGFLGEERLTFDSHQFSGRKDSEVFVLVFSSPMSREDFNSYVFKAAVEGDSGKLLVDLKPSVTNRTPDSEQRIGGIYKIDDGSSAMWLDDKHITSLASSNDSITFKFDYKLLVFGGNINLQKSDIKAFTEIDSKKDEIPADLITLTDNNGETIESINRTGIYNVSFNKEFASRDLERSLSFTLLQVKNSNSMRIEVRKQ